MKYLFGASGHAKVIVDIINSTKENRIDGIFDDDETIKEFLDIPFLGKYQANKTNSNGDFFLVSIGDNNIREKVVKRIRENFFSTIHKTSIVSSSAKIGLGTAVMANAVINANTRIGNHCIINTSVVIEHECEINDFVHISPSATLTGGVKVGKGTHVGAGATVIPNINIGKWCVVGAGSVVIRDIPDYSVVVGNPAKVIKLNKNIK